MRAMRRAAGALLALGLVAGCSGAGGGGDVSGTVTYDGKPAEQGSIAFYPTNGPAAGGPITNGQYSVAKVPAGTAKVRISGVKTTGQKKMYDDPGAPLVSTAVEYLPT